MTAMELLAPRYEADVDPAGLYADAGRRRPDRPYVLANMVASCDGATAFDGRAAGLANQADQELFKLIRRSAPVVLVGASTVRAERYRPSTVPGQRIAVVTRSCDLDLSSDLFRSGQGIVVTTEDAEALPLDLATIRVGRGSVDLAAALAALDVTTVLCEGGPALLHQLITADLLDELCLTLGPAIVGGSSNRVGGGPDPAHLIDTHLVHVARDGDHLFLRYVRKDLPGG
jgi:riboflavin biosynthesis pyrimidine reductase